MNPSTTGALMPRSSSPRPPSRRNSESGEAEAFRTGLRGRARSGSWGGVDESDEDEAKMRGTAYVRITSPGGTSRPENPSVEGSGDSGCPASNVSYDLPDLDNMTEEEKLRRRLTFFFMNPVEKFVARRQTPWKLFLQFLKVIFVTTQVTIFGQVRYVHTNFYSDSRITFEHLFFKNWDTVREITAYPPSTGKYALYKKTTFYDLFDHAATTYHDLENLSVSPIFRNSSLSFCVQKFEPVASSTMSTRISAHHDASFGSPFVYDHILGQMKCIKIPDSQLAAFNSSKYLKEAHFDVPWTSLQNMHLNFSVRTYTFRSSGAVVGTECFHFKIFIKFDNEDHDGQIPIELVLEPKRVYCDNPEMPQTTSTTSLRVLNYLIIGMCALSFVLCLRAIVRAQILRSQTRRFFLEHFETKLTIREQLQFLNLWYVVICINDVLIIIGVVITELIESRSSTSDLWDFSCIFLGTGDLLVWIGMLRYLGFFEAYNALILTLKGSLPNVARFALCAAFVYAGYLFCGWLVFAPYHFKFRSLQSTSECLFSLVNGDDMFATFSMMSEKVGLIHGFSRIYLYTFVMLFIYVILSLFIAIIMDTYENIKQFYIHGFPKSRLDEFYMSVTYEPFSTAFYDGSSPGILYVVWCQVMMALYGPQWQGYDRMMADKARGSGDEIDTTPILS